MLSTARITWTSFAHSSLMVVLLASCMNLWSFVWRLGYDLRVVSFDVCEALKFVCRVLIM